MTEPIDSSAPDSASHTIEPHGNHPHDVASIESAAAAAVHDHADRLTGERVMDEHDTPHHQASTPADEPDADTPHVDTSLLSAEAGAPPPRPARPRRDPLPVLFGLGILILIGAVVFLWRHPINALLAASGPDEHVVALQQQVAALQQRLSGLEQRPVPPPPVPVSLAPLEQRLTALEKRPATTATATEAGPMIDQAARDQVAGLAPKVEALGKQMDALSKQMDALTRQQTTLATNESAAVAALSARVDADQQRLATLATQAGQITVVSGRLDAQDQKVGALTTEAATEAGKINGVAERAARVARIQAATAALEAGRPLGDLPAPPGAQGAALAQFRTAPPPTEAALRLTFPEAAAAAATASRPETSQLPFWQAVQTRAEELVTVRRGDSVVVGDPAAGVIARARHALDAGDLPGTVTILGELSGKPAEAFAAWVARAKSLLDARAALATLAAAA
jgi:hypothetical protein